MLKHALVLAALLLPGAYANAHEYTVGDLQREKGELAIEER